MWLGQLPPKLILQVALRQLILNRRGLILLILGSSTGIYLLKQLRDYYRDARVASERRRASPSSTTTGTSSGHIKVGVDARFLAQLRQLLPICIPGVASREAGLLLALTTILIARTYLDIWFSGFNGLVVRSIVSRDHGLFFRNAILLFGFMMWPMSIVNNALKLTINSLSIAFRSRLTEHAHTAYLSDMLYYKVANLDNRIQNADQLLTQDIEKFGENLSHLYSDIAKPLVDIVLFAFKLGQAIGLDAPVYMIGYFIASGLFLRAISPPFGKYIATEQKLEGEFRFTHARIITHSEEIASVSYTHLTLPTIA